MNILNTQRTLKPVSVTTKAQKIHQRRNMDTYSRIYTMNYGSRGFYSVIKNVLQSYE